LVDRVNFSNYGKFANLLYYVASNLLTVADCRMFSKIYEQELGMFILEFLHNDLESVFFLVLLIQN